MANPDSLNSLSRTTAARGNSRSALIIVGVLALMGLAYSIARVDILRARLVTLQMDQDSQRNNNSAASTRVTTLAESQRNLSSQVTQLQTELASTNEQVAVLRGGAVLAQRLSARNEALYLLRMANDQLQLAHDVSGAINSLTAASRTLAINASSDAANQLPNQSIQQQIEKALSQLRALPNDTASIDAQLSSAEAQVANLKLRGIALADVSQPPLPDGGAQRAWLVFKRSVASLFTLRQTGMNSSELLSTDEQLLRRRHMQVLLLNARLAQHLHDQPSYAAALHEARTWLEQHFDGNDSAVSVLNTQLQQMAQQTIAPALPDLAPSIQALAKQLPTPDVSGP